MTSKIDKQAIIAELQKVARMLNTQRLGWREYQKYGTISRTTITDRFGSWNEVLQAAGLLPAIARPKNLPSDEDLLIEIITVTRKLKKIPSRSEMIAHGKYSKTPYTSRWQSFAHARESAYAKYGLPSDIKDNVVPKQMNATTPRRREQTTPTQPSMANNLKPHLLKIANTDTRAFIEEAINCLDSGLYRSAVVMSWIGAVSVLYDYVITSKLSDFNTEARRRDPKWKTATTKDDLVLMKESDFLDILAVLSILGKNVKEQLKNNCLGLRNTCGHPNSFKIGRSTVESHLEILLRNVYEVF